MASFSPPRVPGPEMDALQQPRDVLPLIDAATRALRPGQMLLSSSMTLYDSMSAIQLLDPRVDTGMVSKEEVEQPLLTPERSLPAETVVWVMDELLRREMTFYAGHGLPQTLYTCLLVTFFQRFPGTKEVIGPHPPELVSLVLRSYVLVTMKICDVVWNEMVRGNLREGEDVTTDRAGVWIAEDILPDDIFNELDLAYEWLTNWQDRSQQVWRDGMLDRLRLRMELLYPLCLVYEPASPSLRDPTFHLIPQRTADALHALKSILSRPSPARSPEADGIFDPTICRRLPTSTAPRSIELLSLDQSYVDLAAMLNDLDTAVFVSQQVQWRAWESGFLQLARRPTQMGPFGRSLCQTIFYSEGKVARDRKISYVARAYIEEVCDWSNADFEALLSVCDYDDRMMLRRDLDGWLDALAGVRCRSTRFDAIGRHSAQRLISFIGILGSNRARQKRQLAKSLIEWNRFLRAAGDIVQRLSDIPSERSVRCLYWATERMQGIVAIEALFSGFELELYAASELRLVYWVAVKVLDRQLSTLNALIDQARSGRVKVAMEVERIMMSGLRQLSSAAIVLLSMSSATPAPLVDDEAWQLRYEMRFEWLPPRFGVTPAANGWSAFCSDIARLVAMDTRELRGDALHALDNAATCFRELASHRSPLGLAGNEPLLWLRDFNATVDANLQSLTSSAPPSLDTRWQHRWFPSFHTVQL